MNGLADIAVQYLCTFMFSDEANIDPDFASKEMQSFPKFIAALSDDERAALSAAARRALDYMLRPPDDYDYTTASRVSEEEKAFLESLASGELYEQWPQ